MPECWSSLPNLYSCKGEVISQRKPSSVNFGIWWDGDLLRELLNGNTISKWDWQNETTNVILRDDQAHSPEQRATKSTPCLSGDLFGDLAARGSDVAKTGTTRGCASTRRRFPPSIGFIR